MISRLIVAMIIIIAAGIVIGIKMQQGPKENPKKSSTQSLLDSLEIADKVDSMVKAAKYNAMFDTVGLYRAPVKVISAKLVREEYSSYKSIRLTYKNVSGKTISGIRFKWYGLNAFNEPADMGTSLVKGFGSGYDDDILRADRTTSSTWNILSRDGKKVVLSWAYEVAFEDGTKWELKK